MHHFALITTKEIILASSFLSISIDEVIIINNQSWISIHCDVMIGFNCVAILFILECLVEGGNATNIKTIIVFALMSYGGLFQNQIIKCLTLCLKIDSASTFERVTSRTIVLIKTNKTPYFIEIYYLAHRMNLLNSLYFMMIVSKLEDLQLLYKYFFSSPKFWIP